MKIAVVEVEPSVLIEMLSGHEMERLETTMPDDAAIQWVTWDVDRRRIKLYVVSGEFDDVADGSHPPIFDVIATRHTDMASELLNLVRRSETS